ncbi:MAG: Mur ligase [Bacteroidetes bacterium]|nr:MAG: Mur ligase [Bacteroidota bacterium]
MELMDSRRLTGPNLVFEGPGALLDVQFDAADSGVVDLWRSEMERLREKLGWSQNQLLVLPRHEGAWLVATGPIDQLYSIIELNELAWARASRTQVSNRDAPAVNHDDASILASELTKIKALSVEEENPKLIALQRSAAKHNVTFLWDDDEVSLGLGNGSETFEIDNIPDPDDLTWSRYHDIPLAAVTGTNGKSTNVRLIRQMVECWGKIPGNSSTDWIRVGNEILDTGDYSGPGGARAILRDQRVEVGILEVARGGLLRRGAGVSRVDVALVTNVAEDHMGQYGINSVDDLIDAKLIVAQLIDANGVLVLNADDEGLVRRGSDLLHKNICWFSRNAQSDFISDHIAGGGAACVLVHNDIHYVSDGERTVVCSILDIPITLEGRAAYNVSNSLSAAAVGMALGIPAGKVAAGLKSFSSDPESNPGRGNYFDVNGITVLLDFAHNTHGLKAILEATDALKAKRRLMIIGAAGDRLESEIRNLARAAAGQGLDRILVTDCVGYERDLGPGGVPKIIYDELLRCDEPPERIEVLDSEIKGVKAAFAWARPGDLLILLIKSEREQALAEIRSRMSDS